MSRVKSGVLHLLFFVLFSLLVMFIPNFSASAQDLPNNTPSYNDGSITQDEDKPRKVDARDVFGDGHVDSDGTGLSEDIGQLIQTAVNFLISLANIVFISFMIAYFVIESLMMAFPVVATLMATRVPIQLFSNECAKVCGVKYSYKPGNGQGVGGGSDAGVGSGGANGDDKATFASKFTTYFKERFITLVLCGILLVMCATGLMPWLLNTVINWIIGLLFK